MKQLYILITVIVAIACKTKTQEWQVLDFGVFKIKTPQGWTIVKKDGIDSYVGGLTNGNDSVWFDYGTYEVDLKEDTKAHKAAIDTINGLYSVLTIPQQEGKGVVSVHIPQVINKNQFTIWGQDVKETDIILKMYKTLIFPNSDTSLNPRLTEEKYFFLANGSGKTIFFQRCNSCHSIHYMKVGPPLDELINRRNTEWIYKFITDSTSVANDTLHISMRRLYKDRCLEFPSLTKHDIELLVAYVKSK
jgi:Cytochrome c